MITFWKDVKLYEATAWNHSPIGTKGNRRSRRPARTGKSARKISWKKGRTYRYFKTNGKVIPRRTSYYGSISQWCTCSNWRNIYKKSSAFKRSIAGAKIKARNHWRHITRQTQRTGFQTPAFHCTGWNQRNLCGHGLWYCRRPWSRIWLLQLWSIEYSKKSSCPWYTRHILYQWKCSIAYTNFPCTNSYYGKSWTSYPYHFTRSCISFRCSGRYSLSFIPSNRRIGCWQGNYICRLKRYTGDLY